MIIRNTFLNAQMGQIVQYGNLNLKNREKTLTWVDQKERKKPENAEAAGEKPQPLARIVPIKETINFVKKVETHHDKAQKDIVSCLRGAKLSKHPQKQKDVQKGTAQTSNSQVLA